MAAAVAAGVTVTFGSPYGGRFIPLYLLVIILGIIFSIEITASFYIVANIWKSFFTTNIVYLTFLLFFSAFSNLSTPLIHTF
jgi:hypothetical protein